MDLLQTKGIEKQFLGVKALKGVDFAVKAGEIHALMGENGAGKSTLIKIITGVYPASAGSVYFNGKECKFRSPLDAEHAGISTVYQEVNLLPDLSVAENIYLGRMRPRMGMIDTGRLNYMAWKISSSWQSPAHWTWTASCSSLTNRPPASTKTR